MGVLNSEEEEKLVYVKDEVGGSGGKSWVEINGRGMYGLSGKTQSYLGRKYVSDF